MKHNPFVFRDDASVRRDGCEAKPGGGARFREVGHGFGIVPGTRGRSRNDAALRNGKGPDDSEPSISLEPK
jgi:hypothetical protein